MQCWEFTECGRGPRGQKARTEGVCPAATEAAGEACWLVAGTHCDGGVQGSFAQKLGTCLRCGFYERFDADHRRDVRLSFAHLLRKRTVTRR